MSPNLCINLSPRTATVHSFNCTMLIMRWAGQVECLVEGRGMYRVLVGKRKGKRPIGRSRCRWEDNIKVDLQEVGCGGMDWIELAQDRDRWQALVNAVMNLGVQ